MAAFSRVGMVMACLVKKLILGPSLGEVRKLVRDYLGESVAGRGNG